MALRGLFLGVPGVVSAGIVRGWQMAGHSVAALWYPERLARTRAFDQDRALAAAAPGVSMHGLASRGGVTLRAVPPLLTWPDAASEAAALAPDVVISVLFPDRIPPALLDAFPGRVVNLHPALLPAYRGPWPTFSMLWDRSIHQFGGMTLHLVTPEFDAGPMLGQMPVAFPADRNLSAYYMQLVRAGTALLADRLPAYYGGGPGAGPVPTVQPSGSAARANHDPRTTVLTRALDWQHIEWLCATIPQMTALRAKGAEGAVVRRFLATAGPPTGAPPLCHGGILRMDARDARVNLAVA
jgi:hypothetical protein